MQPLYDAVATYCRERGLIFSASPEQGRVQFSFGSPNCPVGLHCLIDAFQDRQMVAVHVLMPVMVPLARRAEIAELVCRVNFNLLVGSFDFDVENGLLLFRTSACFRGQSVGSEAVEPLFGFAAAAADQWTPAFLAVAADGKSARQARAEILESAARAERSQNDLLDLVREQDDQEGRRRRGAA